MRFMHEPKKMKQPKKRKKKPNKFKIKNKLFNDEDIQKIGIHVEESLDNSFTTVGNGELQLNIN